MKTLKLTIVAAALAAASAAFAQPPAGGQRPPMSPEMQAARESMMKACAADMKTLCDGKEGREIMACMRDNADKVSDGCKDGMAKVRAARQASAPQ
jgi:hypothetical protein